MLDDHTADLLAGGGPPLEEQIAAGIARASERHLPEDERRGCYPVVVIDAPAPQATNADGVAALLAWGAPYFLAGLAAGACVDLAARFVTD